MTRLNGKFHIQAILYLVLFFSLTEICTGKSIENLSAYIFGNIEIPVQVTNKNSTRIVGGVAALSGDFPSLVSIAENGSHNCGGTLLRTRRHVLTAAHCLYGKATTASILTVRIGTIHLDPLDTSADLKNVLAFVTHPNYDPNTSENDIAIMLLENPFDETFSTVNIESNSALSQSYANHRAVIAGWGNTKQVLSPGTSFLPSSNVLKKANVTIVSNTDCGIRYHSDLPRSVLLYTKPAQFLCGLSYADEETCQGDSGGPLFIDGIQTGITSNGNGCADPRFPGIYTRVGFYIDWINYFMNLE